MSSKQAADAARYIDTGSILRVAARYRDQQPACVTDVLAPRSEGGPHDFYSNADYYWPDPDKPDGLPFIGRDGQSNPGNFNAHRRAMRTMRYAVTNLAAAYRLTGEAAWADAAIRWLRAFFLNEATYMAPHLLYAQAIPGVCAGRGIGVIDTLHLIDVPAAIDLVREGMREGDYEGLQAWFAEYLRWMNTHPQGIDERETRNNHAVTWVAQAASFARFVGDGAMLAECRRRYKEILLPNQMAEDGSFPLELSRTKPYNYSCFVLDNMANICLLASTQEDDLWRFALPDGRGLRRGIDFLLPYLEDKAAWPYPPDVEHFDLFPVAMPFLLYAGLEYGDERLLALWQRLPQRPADVEIRRNIAIRCPYVLLA